MGLGEAVGAARWFAEGGGQELVLSGINLGRWGRDLQPARTLPELVRALLEETGLPRLRISSVEPMDWTGEMLAMLAQYGGGEHPRLAPHAHLPLQSGADEILRRMHRRYRPWHYAEKVGALRELLPDAAIGADVMVGFPGETEALFRESYEFIEKQPLTYLHLFPFSSRPGTAGEGLHRAAPVHGGAVKERMGALQRLAARKAAAFAESFVGRRVSAVTLRDGTALTGNFFRVRFADCLEVKSADVVQVGAGDVGEGRAADVVQVGAAEGWVANQLVSLRVAFVEENMEGNMLVGVPEVPAAV